MMWLATRPIVWPVKTAVFSLSTGYKTGRLVGYRRLTMFGLGVVTGLLLAPVPGRELRVQVMERIAPRAPLPAGTGGPYPNAVPRPTDVRI